MHKRHGGNSGVGKHVGLADEAVRRFPRHFVGLCKHAQQVTRVAHERLRRLGDAGEPLQACTKSTEDDLATMSLLCGRMRCMMQASLTCSTRIRTVHSPAGHITTTESPTSDMVAPRMAVSSENIFRWTAMLTLGEMASWATATHAVQCRRVSPGWRGACSSLGTPGDVRR